MKISSKYYFNFYSVCGAVASLVLFVSVILRIIHLANGYGIGDPMQYSNGKKEFSRNTLDTNLGLTRIDGPPGKPWNQTLNRRY